MIRRNILANYLGVGWTMLMGVAFLPLYVRYLGVEAYGLVGIFAVIQAWLTLLDAGVTPAVIRETSRLQAEDQGGEIRRVLRTSEVLASGAGLSSFVVVALGAFFLANSWLHTQALTPAVVTQSFLLMGVVIALRFGENMYRGTFIGLERQVTLNVLTILVTTIRAAGAVAILTRVSSSVLAYFLWQAAVSVFTVILFWLVLHWHLPGTRADARFSRATLHRIWRFSLSIFLITLLGTFLSQTDKVVLSAMLPLRDFGYYAFAATVAAYVRTLVQPVYQAVYPRLVALAADKDIERLAAMYHDSCQVSTVLLSSLGAWLAAFSYPVLTLWARDPAFSANVAPVMSILIVGYALNGILTGPYYLQLAHAWTSLHLRLTLISAIFFVPAVWLAVRSFGIMGGAAAWLAMNVITLTVLVQLMHRRLLTREMGRWYVHDTLFPVAGASIPAVLLRLSVPLPEAGIPKAGVLALTGVLCLVGSTLVAPAARRRATLFWRRLLLPEKRATPLASP